MLRLGDTVEVVSASLWKGERGVLTNRLWGYRGVPVEVFLEAGSVVIFHRRELKKVNNV